LTSPISQNIDSVNNYKKMDQHSQNKSISRKLSYSNVEEGMLNVVLYIRFSLNAFMLIMIILGSK
jgi:hypothetical protein